MFHEICKYYKYNKKMNKKLYININNIDFCEVRPDYLESNIFSVFCLIILVKQQLN